MHHSIECHTVTHSNRHARTLKTLVDVGNAANGPTLKFHGGKKSHGNHGEPVTAELFRRKPVPIDPATTTTTTTTTAIAPQSATSTTSPNIDIIEEVDETESDKKAKRGDFVAYSGAHPLYFGDVTGVNGDLEVAAKRKRILYSSRYEIPEDVLVPFVVGTYGQFGKEAKAFLTKILRPSNPDSQQSKDAAHRYTAQIQIAFHEGNAYMSYREYSIRCEGGRKQSEGGVGEGGERG